MEKRAQITSKTLVTMILLILGFLIVLFLYYQFNWTGRVDDEVCHQSVIYRGTLPGLAGVKEYVPLKCKTEKLCVTSGLVGGSCEEFENVKGVTKIKVKTKEQVERAIAQEIVDCWRMMGEGKLSVFSQWLAEDYGIGSVYPSCVICSRIAFDKAKLEEKGINLDEINVMSYMMTRAVPDRDISYYEYLAGERGKISVKDNIEITDIKEDEEKNPVEGEKTNVVLEELTLETSADSDELAVMFMQISAPTHSGVIRNTVQTLALGYGSSFALAPKIMGKAAIAALRSPWTWAMVVIAGAYQHGSVAYNKAITAGYCGDVSVGDEAREGCSVVRTVNYNMEDISQYCSIIESIP